jgi:hypothetical protein
MKHQKNSSSFVGRTNINNNPGHQQRAGDTDSLYFEGKKRKFQANVKGRLNTPLVMTECITGQSFDRPGGKLPARWIVTSFIKLASTRPLLRN